MFDISMRDTSPGDKEASLFIAWMYACGWKPYCMSLHNRSCRLLHSVTLSALVNSEPRLSRKIDFSALYPPYWRAATFGKRRYRQPSCTATSFQRRDWFELLNGCICDGALYLQFTWLSLLLTQCNTWIEPLSMELPRCCGSPRLKNKRGPAFCPAFFFFLKLSTHFLQIHPFTVSLYKVKVVSLPKLSMYSVSLWLLCYAHKMGSDGKKTTSLPFHCRKINQYMSATICQLNNLFSVKNGLYFST